MIRFVSLNGCYGTICRQRWAERTLSTVTRSHSCVTGRDCSERTSPSNFHIHEKAFIYCACLNIYCTISFSLCFYYRYISYLLVEKLKLSELLCLQDVPIAADSFSVDHSYL